MLQQLQQQIKNQLEKIAINWQPAMMGTAMNSEQ